MRLIVMGFAGATANAYQTADTEQKFPLGIRAVGIPGDFLSAANTLNGSGEFVYCQFAGALACGTVVGFNSLNYTASAIANTAGLGQAVGVLANRVTGASQFGWVQLSGQAPVVNNGTFAADTLVYIQAAGVLTTTQAAGKQINGARSLIAAAATLTKANTRTKVGSPVIQVPNTAGLFCGLAVSGTGIAASVINDIDPGGNLVTLSVAATATGSVTSTFTYTNLGAITLEHPFAQGQIL